MKIGSFEIEYLKGRDIVGLETLIFKKIFYFDDLQPLTYSREKFQIWSLAPQPLLNMAFRFFQLLCKAANNAMTVTRNFYISKFWFQ